MAIICVLRRITSLQVPLHHQATKKATIARISGFTGAVSCVSVSLCQFVARVMRFSVVPVYRLTVFELVVHATCLSTFLLEFVCAVVVGVVFVRLAHHKITRSMVWYTKVTSACRTSASLTAVLKFRALMDVG